MNHTGKIGVKDVASDCICLLFSARDVHTESGESVVFLTPSEAETLANDLLDARQYARTQEEVDAEIGLQEYKREME